MNNINKRFNVSFYKYFYIMNPQKIYNIILKKFNLFNVLGRVYISYEGLNAQISIPKKYYKNIINFIYNLNIKLNNVLINRSSNTKKSFFNLKIKLKKNIVADNIHDYINYNRKGVYLKNAQEVNNMFNKKSVTFIDMRNKYEYEIGHFVNAVNIPFNTFKEQLKNIIDFLKIFKNKKLVMYCTGGIRCEKASSYLINYGFSSIYHIYGGIINYVNSAKENNLPINFVGKMFVFDNRLYEKISHHIISNCHQCKETCDIHRNCRNKKCNKLFIQCDKCAKKFDYFCSNDCVKKNL